MGYFSNASEAEAYWNKWCARCLHHDGCAVWLAHLEHNYEDDGVGRRILDHLIPRSKDGLRNDQCTVFVKRLEYNDVRTAIAEMRILQRKLRERDRP